MQTISNLCMIVAFIWGCVSVLHPAPLQTPPGILVAEDPLQENAPPHDLAPFKGYTLSAVAKYHIRGRVLSTKKYYTNGEDLAPYDVALGWGRMSDQSIIDKMDISQGNRFYFYEYEGSPPIPEKEIIAHSSNNHLIAANFKIAWAIRQLRRGEVATLSGYLVNVNNGSGFHWSTSTSRTDTGAGACEVMYVEDIKVEKSVAPVPATPAPATPAPKA